jgi:hypothetical protein
MSENIITIQKTLESGKVIEMTLNEVKEDGELTKATITVNEDVYEIPAIDTEHPSMPKARLGWFARTGDIRLLEEPYAVARLLTNALEGTTGKKYKEVEVLVCGEVQKFENGFLGKKCKAGDAVAQDDSLKVTKGRLSHSVAAASLKAPEVKYF